MLQKISIYNPLQHKLKGVFLFYRDFTKKHHHHPGVTPLLNGTDTLHSMREITALAVPVIAGMVSHSILNFADRYFIAKLGVEEAAGAGICVTIMWFLLSLSTLVTGGTIALVSRKIRECDEGEVIQSAQQSIFIAIVLSVVITAICFLLSQPLFSFFGVEPGVES